MKSSSREKAISESPWGYLLPDVEALYSRKVAVLMGGIGDEREVSLASGRAIYDALCEELDDIQALDVGEETPVELKRILDGADTVFIALHGTYGEDGTVQGYLDELAVAYTGSGRKASSISFLKDVSREAFVAAGVPVAEGLHLSVDKSVFLEEAGRMGVPLVVKPVDSGSSVGVSIVRGLDGLEAAFDEAARVTRRGIVVERYIDGREITVGVLDDKALPLVELIPGREFYDYEAKYSDPATQYVVPAELEPDMKVEIEQSALTAFRTLGCRGFGRVDGMLGEDGYVVLEVNSIPGFTSHSLLPMAARSLGLDLTALAMLITALAAHPRKDSKC